MEKHPIFFFLSDCHAVNQKGECFHKGTFLECSNDLCGGMGQGAKAAGGEWEAVCVYLLLVTVCVVGALKAI